MILMNYEWPGNIRELRNVIERHIILGDKYDEETISPQDDELTNQNVISLPLKNARKVFEKHYLQSQINRFDGNISKTASFIGMERSALHRKLKQLGISEGLKK
jgi:two-component system nitrogen regulation response regulator NtrX